MKYVIPAILLISVIFSACKKISVYDSFIIGVKEAIKLTLDVLPFLVGIFVMCEIFSESGLAEKLVLVLEKPFSILGIPKEVIELVLIRPLSGSGSIVLTERIFSEYGVDSYVSKCASVISGCSDTVFYIVAVYLSKAKDKNTYGAVPIALFANFCGNIFACFLCKIL